MSTRVVANHADWLTLTEPVGPFLTLPVLRRVWPGGLDRTPAATRVELRERVELLGTDDGERRQFIDWVLRRLLAFGPRLREGQAVPDTLTITLAEHATVLRPDFAVVGPAEPDRPEGRTRLLVCVWPAGTDLAAHAAGEVWAASPIDRMAAHCRSVGVELGLVTDGDRFTLVWAPRTGPIGRATWVATVFAEAAEHTLLDSFTSVLGAKRFFAVAADDQLEALLQTSASAQAEVTGQLGYQVRRAVELLVAAFSQGNRERGGILLAGLDPHHVYEAACTTMMRLVFLLYAEERRLLPLGDELYDRSYGVSPLRQMLRDTADAIGNEETLEHSHTAWPRLLATFRAVHGGLAHDELRIPAYGGHLFDPDRYPFLEGRQLDESWRTHASTPLPIDDRTILGVLTSLQILQMREAGITEARRLSFRSLDVEQIGHVYESLLDHGAKRVEETAVGLVGRPGEEPEIALAELEGHAARGDDNLVTWLTGITGRSDKQLRGLLSKPADELRLRRLRVACDNDGALAERLRPFMWLLRDDLRDLPTVYLDGSIYVTEVSHRRDSGTEYTTKELADEVVRYALEPLVYAPGPAEGADPSDWKLKTSDEILALRICDPAVGSGAILTAACRYLADRLVEAWGTEGRTPTIAEADPSDDIDDIVIEARRAIAEQCLYGVDRDPMAVEMAKLSLWLVTMAKERPFSFLDHTLRAGDSLLGITSIEQVTRFHIDPTTAQAPLSFAGDLEPLVKEALKLRKRIEATPVLSVRDVEEKSRLLTRADDLVQVVNLAADLVVGAALSTAGDSKRDLDTRLALAGAELRKALDVENAEERQHQIDRLIGVSAKWLNEGRPAGAPARRPLHWPLAFPEVFLAGQERGFSGFCGNPPFLHGQKLTGRLGVDVREYLVQNLAEGRRGSADLVAYFYLRVLSLLSPRGHAGLLATNTIAEGDTLAVGLAAMLSSGARITRAVRSRPWPGSAALEVAIVWLTMAEWRSPPVLDGVSADGAITARLTRETRVVGEPEKLAANQSIAFRGTIVLGMGFTLEPDAARAFVENDPRNAEVLRPYLSAEDVLGRPDCTASRWVIDFRDLSIDEARRYPELFDIVDHLVRPEREAARGRNAVATQRANAWWQFASYTKTLYDAIGDGRTVVVVPNTSKYATPARVPAGAVYSNSLVVFASESFELFGLLSSSIHHAWAVTYGSTLETRTRYGPSDCFENFPLPAQRVEVRPCAERLEAHRSKLMLESELGLTKTYNRVHDEGVDDDRVVRLRELHQRLDEAVASSYGWADLGLNHGFHETPHGFRWTVGAAARAEVLDRLLELNQQRYAAEVAGGLHTKRQAKGGAKRASVKKAAATRQHGLFGANDEDPG